MVGVPGGGMGLTLAENWRGVEREAGALVLKGDSPPFPVAKGKQIQGFFPPVNYYSLLVFNVWDCSIFTGALGKVYRLWLSFPLE